MKEYMKKYINETDEYIKQKDHKNLDKYMDEFLTKVKFFQHERLIHLLVTLFYAIFCVIFMVLITLSWIFVPIALLLMIFLIFYVFHYFFLENAVQYMYQQYDKLKKLTNKKAE